jgi:hypothetical protein
LTPRVWSDSLAVETGISLQPNRQRHAVIGWLAGNLEKPCQDAERNDDDCDQQEAAFLPHAGSMGNYDSSFKPEAKSAGHSDRKMSGTEWNPSLPCGARFWRPVAGFGGGGVDLVEGVGGEPANRRGLIIQKGQQDRDCRPGFRPEFPKRINGIPAQVRVFRGNARTGRCSIRFGQNFDQSGNYNFGSTMDGTKGARGKLTNDDICVLETRDQGRNRGFCRWTNLLQALHRREAHLIIRVTQQMQQARHSRRSVRLKDLESHNCSVVILTGGNPQSETSQICPMRGDDELSEPEFHSRIPVTGPLQQDWEGVGAHCADGIPGLACRRLSTGIDGEDVCIGVILINPEEKWFSPVNRLGWLFGGQNEPCGERKPDHNERGDENAAFLPHAGSMENDDSRFKPEAKPAGHPDGEMSGTLLLAECHQASLPCGVRFWRPVAGFGDAGEIGDLTGEGLVIGWESW